MKNISLCDRCYDMFFYISFIIIFIVVKIVFRLFGAEDVDLRTLTAPPIVPSPPPPPQISEVPNPEVSKSWAKFKETKPDTFNKTFKSPTKIASGELNESLVDKDAMDVDMRGKSAQNNKSHILRKAEEALNAGSISFDEYKNIMSRVIIVWIFIIFH